MNADPFGLVKVDWTIKSLNERLEALKLGEKLVIDGLHDSVYHGSIGVSTSKLKLFIECPLKYKAKYVDGSIKPTEASYFDFGRAVHTVILQPWLLKGEYIEQPASIKVRRGKAWDEFKQTADDAGMTVLTSDQMQDLIVLKRSMDATPRAKALVSGGIAERSYFTRDAETGLIVKCRPDYMIGDLIVDLKTSQSSEPAQFARQAKRLGYHVQDALYSYITGASEFAFLVVESSRPFVITAPMIMSDEMKELGYLQYRKALRELKNSIDTGIWGGYTDEPVIIEANGFDKAEIEKLTAVDLEVAA